MLEAENFIGIYENAFSEDFCIRAINYFESMDQGNCTVSRQAMGNKKIQKDDMQFFTEEETFIHVAYSKELRSEFSNIFWNTAYASYVKQYSVLDEASERHVMYCTKIQRTKVGGGYHAWHYESDSRATSNRLLTYILYLNDVDEGGETEFLYTPKRVKAKAGTLVLFPAAFTHTHRGNPPLSNTKYIITGWTEF